MGLKSVTFGYTKHSYQKNIETVLVLKTQEVENCREMVPQC